VGHRAGQWSTHNYGVTRHLKENTVNLHLSLAPLVSLLAGILILIMPRLLNYIIALYLIIFGVLGLVGDVHFH
jgi:lipoprotein signal peptidase